MFAVWDGHDRLQSESGDRCGLGVSQAIKSKAGKYLLILFTLAVSSLIAEALYFFWASSPAAVAEKEDVIVVFASSPKRIEAGYQLAQAGYAPVLVVSPAGRDKMAAYDRKYDLPAGVTKIIEDRARTTFENAFYTRKIVTDHGFNTLILVTSTYHLPRSALLLRIFLWGTGVKIQLYGAPAKNLPKQFYNEMVKLWFSVGEMVLWQLTGTLPRQNPKYNKTVRFLKSRLLL